MDFKKDTKDVNNTNIAKSIQHFKLEKILDTTVTSSCSVETNCLTASKVNVLTKCEQCHNKGVNFYLGQNNSNKTKLLKAIVILLASICAAYVCILSSRRYFHTWVQTVIERTDVHVSEISFPAITICPVGGLNLARLKTEAKSFMPSNSDNNVQDLHLLLNSLNNVMWPIMDVDDENTLETPIQRNESIKIEQFLDSLDETHAYEAINLNQLMYFLTFECEDIFAECTWRRSKVSCCTLFRKIHTYKGVCYAFNSLRVEDPNPSWPWIVSDSGLNTGLRVLIKRSSIGNYYEKVATMIHDSKEIGSSDIIYLSGERVVITVNPLRFTADNDIHTISPDIRHCYFTGELKLFGKSRSNCMVECRLLYIERNCNCTYIFPVAASAKAYNINSLPICRASNLKCIYNHKDALLSTGNILEEKNIGGYEFNTYNCQCYPNCNYIQYGTMVNSDNTGEASSKDFIDLQVQYQHDTLFSYRSTLCFNLLDLIVSYGGIAGLFLGLSLVGVIELLHDFIVYWKQRTQKPLKTHDTQNDKTKDINCIK